MKFSYKFSNLFGTVYRGGDLIFTPDGNSVISPVGNKITIFDLKNHKSETLPIESRFNFTSLDLSPNGIRYDKLAFDMKASLSQYLNFFSSLLAANEDGEIVLISLISRSVLHRLRTNRNINCIKFSPDSKHFAITKEDCAFVYSAPGPYSREYNPFSMERVLKGSYNDTTCLAWSSCSRFLAVGSKDMSVRIYSLDKFENFNVCSLGGLSETCVAAFFETSSLDCYSVSKGGHLLVWEASIGLEDLVPYVEGEGGDRKRKTKKKNPDPEEDDIEETENGASEKTKTITAEENEISRVIYKRTARHYLKDHLEVEKGTRPDLTSADYHQKTKILVTGFSSGAFLLFSLPDCSLVHSLAISDQRIHSVRFNEAGDWIVLGCPDLGQLLVWEWQSETYVMKQQGHASDMTCLCYSPDGSLLATGGQDSKIKLWTCSTGFCFVTFSEHQSAVTGLVFTNNGKVVISSSLDGTVRAFDMTRYRNFKTLTTPRPVQLSCVSVDSSGDLIAAGGKDVFEVYLWSLTTGRLVEVLGGHEGPLGGVAFSPSPTSTMLATVSWDKTLRIWDAISATATREVIQLGSDGLALAWRPDGQRISVATLQGHLVTFDSKSGSQVGSINGRRDLGGGRSDADKISAKKKREAAHFSSLCYSADGSTLLAGGQSKHICIYHVEESLLLKKFEITQNRSFQAMDETINRRKTTEFGPLASIEDREDGTNLKLAGTKAADMSSRTLRMEVRVSGLQFSPTGRSFSGVTTEGLLVYSLDRHLVFDPLNLSMDITPQKIRSELAKKNYLKSLVMSLKLAEKPLIRQCVETVPHENISLISQQLNLAYLPSLLMFIAEESEVSRHIQFYLIWTKSLLYNHGSYLKTESKQFTPVLNLLIKNLTKKSEELSKICDYNKYTMKYLIGLNETRNYGDDNEESDEDMETDGIAKDVTNDVDSDEDMEELAAKWTDDDEDAENDDDEDDEESDA